MDARFAGDSVELFGGALESGTLCTREDFDDPMAADARIRYLRGSSADVHFAAEITNELLAALDPPGVYSVSADAESVPLQVNFLRLLRFDLEGTIRASDVVLEGVLPANMPVFGGQSFRLDVNFRSSASPADDPLLDECASFAEGD